MCLIVEIGIAFEAIGDSQLQSDIARHKRDSQDSSSLPGMDKGLWSLCRHPNYFGEISFWMGVYLMGVNAMNAANLDAQFSMLIFLFGPFAVFALIYFGSLPLMEERQLKRRPEFYRAYMRRVTFKLLPVSNVLGSLVRLYKSLKDEQYYQKRRKANRKSAPKSK